MPDGFSHTRPSATSIWEKIGVLGYLSCWPWEVSVSSGPRAHVDRPGDAVIDARGGDDTAAVGVANQDDRAADPAEGPYRRGDILDVESRPYWADITS